MIPIGANNVVRSVGIGAVVKLFVRAKHWQIFLLLFGIGYVGGSTAMFLSLTAARSPEELLKISLPFGFVMVPLFVFSMSIPIHFPKRLAWHKALDTPTDNSIDITGTKFYLTPHWRNV